MYTTIRLRNVRAWADSGDIALAPLTLFYGANGAGKSSIAQALDALARIADRGFTDPAALVAALPAEAVRDMIRDREPTRLIGIDLAWQPDASMQAALVQGARRLAVSVELGLDPAGRPRLHGLHWTVTDKADRPLRVVAVHDGHPVDKDAAAIDVLAAATAAAVGGFVMLGPLRARPRRSYAVPARVPADVGPRGQGAVPAMAAADRAGRRLSIGDGAARGFADMISDRLATLGLVAGVDLVDAPVESVAGPSFRFPDAPRSGAQVALMENLTHSYGDQILFLGAELEVERGDRIAFVGPNGAGKSTLLRLIMGMESPEEGSARLGEHNVIARYFEQNQAEALDLSKTVIDTMFEAVPDWTQTQVRSLLGSFCFSNDTVFKEVGKLSGGEKARLALALMLLSPCNLLVLDEPTNHLDIPAKQMLEDALCAYEGAALLVSHDRYFISRVANRIVELRDGELILYRGDYDYYVEKKAEEREAAAAALRQAEQDARRKAKREKQKEREARRRNAA